MSLQNPVLNHTPGGWLKKPVPLFIHNIDPTFLKRFDHILIVIMIYEINSTSTGMTNGENHMLISGGVHNYAMRHFGRRRSTRRKIFGQKIQHSMSLIGNAPANQIALLHVLAHAGGLAGGSMTASRTGGEDRTTEVDNGRHVGRMTIDLAFIPLAAANGYYEYALVKYERSTSVPTIGTDPVPTSADFVTDGIQRALRSMTPGYVVQYGMIPITAETTVTRKIIIKWDKFRKAQVRDGDYFVLIMFNRASASNTYDIYCRYNTYTVK